MPATSLAYLDPMSGSILIQLIVGGAVGLGLFFWRSIARLFRVFRRNRQHIRADDS